MQMHTYNFKGLNANLTKENYEQSDWTIRFYASVYWTFRTIICVSVTPTNRVKLQSSANLPILAR